ncbi:NtaA/DmoA family FMN-dependent monooxygenase [Quadrisphaera oryzae]|uniref:NtaA/DmoA family FMN-dependent monooxygenase n=1 Tax=Quadrisphaera TaxID=317661 RepID=UPI0016493198|nr:NtaA/DmoA family FMN-dependent monooxygenase [Quadrisphaera sp. RL12-1S]MBC3762380.1 NtaA/DmoA family FMN-dependent monooxygenase [Quadrisphaera sp. RL12-1S]
MPSTEEKQVKLGLFETPVLNVGGMTTWTHPDNQTHRYADLSYWVETAERLQDATFDFCFLADSYGHGEIGGARPDVNAREAMELPRLDPMLLVPAMAHAAQQLGFVVTASTVFEPPFANARRFSTLDHLTRGRVGWNVVTSSFAESASANFGRPMVPHDERYAMAEDHLLTTYAVLEGSWEDDAVLADKAGRTYADPAKVHRVTRTGPYFSVDGYSNTAASPQRTPVLFQAGTSTAGLGVGARHAECVFLQGSTKARLSEHVATLDRLAVEAGRAPGSVRTMVGLSVVVAPTREEAERRYAEYLALNTRESAIASYALFTGIDLGAYDPDAPFAGIRTEMGQSQVDRHLRQAGGAPGPTVGDVIEAHRTRGSRGMVAVGSPDDVVGEVLDLVDSTGVDGFLLEPFVQPGSVVDVAEHVVPRLRAAGRFRTEYTEETLRERMFGAGHRHLPADHPGAAARTWATA